jgi:hypothetical protein
MSGLNHLFAGHKVFLFFSLCCIGYYVIVSFLMVNILPSLKSIPQQIEKGEIIYVACKQAREKQK